MSAWAVTSDARRLRSAGPLLGVLADRRQRLVGCAVRLGRGAERRDRVDRAARPPRRGPPQTPRRRRELGAVVAGPGPCAARRRPARRRGRPRRPRARCGGAPCASRAAAASFSIASSSAVAPSGPDDRGPRLAGRGPAVAGRDRGLAPRRSRRARPSSPLRASATLPRDGRPGRRARRPSSASTSPSRRRASRASTAAIRAGELARGSSGASRSRSRSSWIRAASRVEGRLARFASARRSRSASPRAARRLLRLGVVEPLADLERALQLLAGRRDRGSQRPDLLVAVLRLDEPDLLLRVADPLVGRDEQAVRLAGEPARAPVALLGLAPAARDRATATADDQRTPTPPTRSSIPSRTAATRRRSRRPGCVTGRPVGAGVAGAPSGRSSLAAVPSASAAAIAARRSRRRPDAARARRR